MIGTRLGPYTIVERIGKGGMGEVYLARDERLQRDVAVKVLPKDAFADDAARRRFHREGVALARLNHPHIAAVYDFDAEGGVDYLVMEYVAGEPLSEKLAAGPLPETEVVRIGIAVAEALDEAHQQGVIHRDLKPQNIRLSRRGEPKVLDFGVSALLRSEDHEATTETKAVAGTIHYMSPEQMRGRPPDPRSDLWSLGVVLFEMATGARPFQGAVSTAVVEAVLHEEPKDPRSLNGNLSTELGRIVLSCLRKDPEERVPSARALANELRRLSGSSQEYPATTRRARSAKHFPWALPAALAVVLVLAATLWLAHGKRGAPAAIRSLAVLPLSNLSPDPERAYFADAMTEELTSEIASLRSLRVISRTSADRYRESDKTMPEIAGELDVDALLEGSVLQSDGQVRITVQLIDGRTDDHLWSESYERSDADAIGLQRDVARAVAREIQLALTPEEERHLAARPTRDTEAYDAYLRAQYLLASNRTSQEIDSAVRDAEMAVTLDPGYAEAYLALAQGCVQKIFFWQGGAEYDQRAFLAVEKALALDPRLAQAHVARGNLYYTRLHGFDIARAVTEFRRAIDSNPNLAEAHHGVGGALTHAGLHDEAAESFRTTLALDPHHDGAKLRWARALWQSGKFQEAAELYARFDHVHFERAVTLAYLDRRKESWDLVRRSGSDTEATESWERSLSGLADWNAGRAFLHALEGDFGAAEREAGLALERGKDSDHFHHAAFVLSAAHAEMGQAERAVALMKQVAASGMPNYPLFRDNPSTRKLSGKPVYEEFMSELKVRWDALSSELSPRR